MAVATNDPAEMYLARLGTDHSRQTATSALRTVARLLGVARIDWSTLVYADLATVRAGLTAYSTSFGNLCWSVIRQVLVEARRLRIVDPQLVEDVLSLPRLRGSSGRLGRDIDDDEVGALLDVVSTDAVQARRDGALLALLIYGGLRRSECASIAVTDWCATTRTVTVRHGKGRKPRNVPMPVSAAHLIDQWLEVHPGDGQLLRGVDRWGHVCGPLSPTAIPKILERLCVDADIAAVSAHAFRARRITEVISHPSGGLSLAARLAGHSSTSVTARYDRRGTDALTQVVTDLDTTGFQLTAVPRLVA